MTAPQPLSGRSKRILEETSRHLQFATRGLSRLSIEEYRWLAGFCGQVAAPFELTEQLANAERLGRVITAYLEERRQP